MVLLLHVLFITGLLVSRHQHKVHLLSTLVEADFTAMQQLIVNWNTPHAVRKIQGMCYSWLLIVLKLLFTLINTSDINYCYCAL